MPQKTNQSLSKGIDILFTFTHQKPLLTIDDISSMVRMPKSTCYRFLSTLKSKKMIELDSVSGKYRLGTRVLRLESAVLQSIDLARIAIPFLQRLSAASGETSQLVVLAGGEGVCIEKVDSPHALRVMPDKGTAIGLHSGASGKVVMAYLTPKEQNRIIEERGLKAFTPNTITDPFLLKERLREIKKVGYATSEGEIYKGTKAVAAPIFDHRRRVIGSISVAGPAERFASLTTETLIIEVIEAAKDISKILQGKIGS